MVALSGRDELDATAAHLASTAAENEETAVVLAGLADESTPWLRLARSGVDLVTLSEAELAIAEDWLRDETRGIALPAGVVLASLRDRAASIGAAVGTKRLCVTCSASSGAVLWCQGGRRPNGMRKPDLFF